MNMSHLQYFFDAVRGGSLGEAARRNLVTHSAVSQAIRSLERELGAPLLHHAKRRFELTEEGRWLFEQSGHLLDESARVKNDFGSAKKEPRGELSIGSPQSLVADSLFVPLDQLRKKHSALTVRVMTGAAYHIKSLVLSQQCQIGFVLDDHKLDDFQTESISKGRFVLVAKTSKLDPQKLGVIVTDVDKEEVRHLRSEWKKAHSKELPVALELLSWSLIKSMTLLGGNIGYLPHYVVAKELKAKTLVELPIAGKAYQYEIKALWLGHRTLSRNAQAFLDQVKGVDLRPARR